MSVSRFVMGLSLAGVMLINACVASAQAYPSKPVRLINSAVGSSGDFVSRLMSTPLSSSLGQPVIVENHPSALVGEITAQAPADGYTLLVAGGTFMIGPLLAKTQYDPIKDFSPVTLLIRTPNVLVVHPSLPAESVKELIAIAKARPGELNYASAGTGSTSHLSAELFNSMAGVKIVRINYKSTSGGQNDLMGGQVQLMFATAAGVIPFVKSGKLRALAVTSPKPSALVPDLPTVASSGLPGYESASILGILTPAGTPAAVINRLNQDIVRVLNRTDVQEKLLNAGSDATPSSPEEFGTWMKSEIARMGKVIKDAGIKLE